MAYDAIYRKRIFREAPKHETSGAAQWEDTGWNLVKYPEGPECFEPRDYVPITGVANVKSKRFTEVLFWDKSEFVPSIDNGVAGILQPAFT